MQPWEADRSLTVEMARGAIGARFPTIDTTEMRYVGAGWDFDVFATGDGWAFRFPRRARVAEIFERERSILDLVSRALPRRMSVPRVELVAEPTPEFPYRFAGHRFISGVSAEALGEDVAAVFAREIGIALGAIHSISEDEARKAGLVEMDLDDIGRTEWLERGLARAFALRGLDPIVDRALMWADQEGRAIQAYGGPLRFVHQDLVPDHVIIDPATGRITGTLDWTDAILGDPARDFVFLVTWRGWSFVEEVARSYPHAIDADFRKRLRLMARLLAIVWLGIAHESGGVGNVARHIRWVRNAFRE